MLCVKVGRGGWLIADMTDGVCITVFRLKMLQFAAPVSERGRERMRERRE